MLVYTLSCSVNGGLVSVLVLSVRSRLALSHSVLDSELQCQNLLLHQGEEVGQLTTC